MEELEKLARKGKLDEVESAWMDLVGGDSIPWAGLLAVAEVMGRHGGAGRLESLLWCLLTELKERGEADAALKVALAGCALLPQSDQIRRDAADLYRRLHADSPAMEALIAFTLGDQALPLDAAVERLKALEQLRPGAYLREDPGARHGRVEEISAQERCIVARFEDGLKRYGPAQAEALKPVASDDFRALVIFERERLSEMARNAPEELMILALKTFGRLDQGRLKLYVAPLLGGASWAKWWAELKGLIEVSPHVGLTDGSRPSLFLRSRPQEREERLRGEFDAAGPMEKLEMALSVLAEGAELTDQRRALLEHFARAAAALAAPDSPAQTALASLAVSERLSEALPEAAGLARPSPAQWLECEDLVGVLSDGVPEGRVLEQTLDALRRWLPDRWRSLYAAAVTRLQRAGCEHAARALAAAGAWDELRGAVAEVMAGGQQRPGPVLWLWKALSTRSYPQALGGVDRAAALRLVLSLGAELSRGGAASKSEARLTRSQVRQALLGGDTTVLAETMKGCDESTAAGLMKLAERCGGLTRLARNDLVRLLCSHRPELFGKKEAPPWQEDVIYTSPAGLQKREQQLDYIANKRLPEVIRELGEAASLGDLSENAEFTAAVEERGRLAAETVRMRKEIGKAKLITPQMASTEHVTVGARVRARNLDTGEVETLTFLGPWDADPKAGIYSYRAPLAQAFMGKKVGEEVSFESPGGLRRWEVVETGPAE